MKETDYDYPPPPPGSQCVSNGLGVKQSLGQAAAVCEGHSPRR